MTLLELLRKSCVVRQGTEQTYEQTNKHYKHQIQTTCIVPWNGNIWFFSKREEKSKVTVIGKVLGLAR